MYTGLAEAHLDVSDLDDSIEFYENLGMEVAWRDEDVAFVWAEEGRSWLGLWQNGKPENHVAFDVTYEDMQNAEAWLAERDIEKREPRGADSNPFVRPHQGNASLYFEDPDGNSLEFLAWLPEGMDEDWEETVSLEEWEGVDDGDV